MENSHTWDICPVSKPRMTQKDKWAKRDCVVNYFIFKDECRLKKVTFKEYGCAFEFRIPMPKSWGKRKKATMCGKPHQQKPDIDNLLKALFDAVYDDDSKIWQVGGVMKLWDYEGSITIHGLDASIS